MSGGGLSAFVEAAVGRRAAVVHGWIWAFAYILYLQYTVTFVVYDILPPVFPGVSGSTARRSNWWCPSSRSCARTWVRAMLAGLGVLAAVQLVLMVVLAVIEFSHSSAHLTSHPELADTGKATGNTALLFVCASLPLYLGAEVRGGSKTMRRVAGGDCGRRRCIPGDGNPVRGSSRRAARRRGPRSRNRSGLQRPRPRGARSRTSGSLGSGTPGSRGSPT